jgi:hypothetical protein
MRDLRARSDSSEQRRARTGTTLIGWIERGFDLFGGLGHGHRMRPLVESA